MYLFLGGEGEHNSTQNRAQRMQCVERRPEGYKMRQEFKVIPKSLVQGTLKLNISLK